MIPTTVTGVPPVFVIWEAAAAKAVWQRTGTEGPTEGSMPASSRAADAAQVSAVPLRPRIGRVFAPARAAQVALTARRGAPVLDLVRAAVARRTGDQALCSHTYPFSHSPQSRGVPRDCGGPERHQAGSVHWPKRRSRSRGAPHSSRAEAWLRLSTAAQCGDRFSPNDVVPRRRGRPACGRGRW